VKSFPADNASDFWSERVRLSTDPALGEPLGGPVGKHFRRGRERGSSKWHHYFSVYDRHLGHHSGRDLRLLEIGVGRGGSLEMWREFLGRGAEIIGVDARDELSHFGHDNIKIRIGNQGDRKFLRSLVKEFGTFDVIIDDGSHRPSHQITTLEELYPALTTDPGIYLVEDLHTNSWARYLDGDATFVDRATGLVDALYEPYRTIQRVHDVLTVRQDGGEIHIGGRPSQDPPRVVVSRFAASLGGLHFYDSIIVLEKTERYLPTVESVPGSGIIDPPPSED
jgi:hypothetical protein